MIVSNLENADRLESLHPKFKQLFEFVRSNDLLNRERGRIDIDGDLLYINKIDADCMPAEKQVLEVHRDYIDVQILLEGSENIGWKALEDVREEVQAYDAKGDCALYADKPSFWLTLKPGQFAVFFPEDAHAPLVGEGPVRKLVAKIKCSL